MAGNGETRGAARLMCFARTLFAVAIGCCAFLIGPSAASAFVIFQSSTDGTSDFVVFETEEHMAPGDTDFDRDLYLRDRDNTVEGGTTELVTIGPTGGNGDFSNNFLATSSDGLRVYFSTNESLVSGDTDVNIDVYERNAATDTTTLISTGPTDPGPGAGGGDAREFVHLIDSTGQVFFQTEARLLNTDTDLQEDVYVFDADAPAPLVHVSQGPGDTGTQEVDFVGVSDSGQRVFLQTDEPFVSFDGTTDIYERNLSSSVTTLVTPGTSVAVGFHDNSADGTRVIFSSTEAIPGAGTDTDTGKRDLFQALGGVITLLSTGPGPGAQAVLDVNFQRASSDATKVFFTTNAAMVAGETDTVQDVYMRSGSTTTLISAGTINGNGLTGDFVADFNDISTTGSFAFFSTDEAMVLGDGDSAKDIYRTDTATGALTRMSAGTNDQGAFDARFRAAIPDGSRVILESQEQMTTDDADTAQDVFGASNGSSIFRASAGSAGTFDGNGPFSATFAGTTPGTNVFITTFERLSALDTDNDQDLYVGGFTAFRLISVDSVAPETTITDPPNGSVRSSRVDLEFSSSDPGSTFECSLDGSSFATCASPRSLALGEGEHTFAVRATDAPGNVDPTPAEATFTVDTVSPDVLITSGPKAKTKKTKAKFKYEADEGDVEFRCKLDGGNYASCPAAGMDFTGVSQGRHVFRVRAVDEAGNTSDAARYVWTVS
ncbi:MAG: large repetitive protein [Solirubrobacterales bacterium]|jgi:hypothetical protein|nr:large repetitive protein [Solirubrobacterales bacterium]